MVFGEFVAGPDPQPVLVRSVSLNSGRVRDVTRIAPKRNGRFAIHPAGDRMAILDKEDHHRERKATWLLRIILLDSLVERVVIPERTDPILAVPWDVGWTAGGALLIASQAALETVDESTGARSRALRFPDGTLGVTFRDKTHPGILVTQSAEALAVYLVDAAGARKVADRPLAGYTDYARRPGGDEVVELVSRYDGVVYYSLIRPDGAADSFTLSGPKVEGIVDLIGTTLAGTYLIWPIARDDPAALGAVGSALIYSAGYDGKLTLVEGVRNWGEYGPLGISPDGRALVVPAGEKAASDANFAIAICCERRPAVPLLDYGDRFVIGWIPDR